MNIFPQKSENEYNVPKEVKEMYRLRPFKNTFNNSTALSVYTYYMTIGNLL